jgi:hypothetical protein
LTLLRDRLPEPVGFFESQGLALQRGGKWRTTRCEFHGGSDSMRVNTESGAFVCMAGCGARGGDVLAYQMAAHGQEFIEAAKALGAWEDDQRAPAHALRKPLPFRARDGLEVLRDEAMLAAVAAGNVSQGVQLTDEDRARLHEAAGRITFIANAVIA